MMGPGEVPDIVRTCTRRVSWGVLVNNLLILLQQYRKQTPSGEIEYR